MSKRQVSKGLFFLAAFLSFLLSVYLFFLVGSREQESLSACGCRRFFRLVPCCSAVGNAMPDIRIFIRGAFFTLIVVAGIVLLIWAAVEDGRVQAFRTGTGVQLVHESLAPWSLWAELENLLVAPR